MSGTLRWRLERLRGMTPAEAVYRLLRAIQARFERRLLDRAVPPPDAAHCGNAWIAKDPNVNASAYAQAAERIAEGRLDIYALRALNLGFPPRWNRDPKSGIEAPPVYGKRLDTANPDLVGDIHYLWQPNRHAHLVTLAQAHALTKKRLYLETLEEHLDTWFLACPHGIGPNWSSALEAGVRLVNWSMAWQLVADALPADLRDRWLRSVYQHCAFIRGWFTLHASAAHRLIGEAAGLFIAALTWPHWAESRGWAATAKVILERELIAQTSPDGVSREQSIRIHEFVLDRALLCLLVGKANGQWFSPDIEARAEAMLDFLASITDVGGNVPDFGDCAGADSVLTRSLLATGAIIFKRGDFKLKAGELDDRTRWLLGRDADAQFATLDVEATRLPLRQAFPEGGYFVAGCAFDTPAELRLVIDAGPVGYRTAATHGHADALSFTLSVGGREFLVDPGTYSYSTQPAWRRYFRGTAAHNTVRIDALDQSLAACRFRWAKRARAGCSLWLSSPEKDTFEGWHDGYMRLDDPVKHRRLLELDKIARRIVVEDALEMGEEHDVEIFFHLSERCRVEPAGSASFVVRHETQEIRINLPAAEGASARVHEGNLAPVQGWRSRSFDVRVPAPVIVWQARLCGSVRLRTEIAIL